MTLLKPLFFQCRVLNGFAVLFLISACLGKVSGEDDQDSIAVVNIFEHGPVQNGRNNQGCPVKATGIPEEPQTSVSLCLRFALYRMPSLGHDPFLFGSFNSPLALRLVHFGAYPFSIFQFRWTHYKGKLAKIGPDQFFLYWFPPHFPLSLLQWYSMCISYDAQTDLMLAVMNGRTIGNFTNKDFDETQVPMFLSDFSGLGCVFGRGDQGNGARMRATDLQIGDAALSHERMKSITTCRERYRGNLYSWDLSTLSFFKDGSVSDMPTISHKKFATLCRDETLLLAFGGKEPVKPSHSKALEVCAGFGGRLAMPKTMEEEVEKFHKVLVRDVPEEPPRRRRFWLPLIRQGRRWVNSLTGAEPDYANWAEVEPNGGIAENCTALIITNTTKIGEWHDYPCFTEMGFICEIQNNIRLELLGLCENSVIDKEFTGIGFAGDRRSFQGKYSFQIEWNKSMKIWELVSEDYQVRAFYNQSMDYPLGVREWLVVNDLCWEPGMYRVNISLSSCFGSQFACGSGVCQPLQNRCDQKKDCADGSDEVGCNILQVDELTYIKDFLPPPLGDSKKLHVNASIVVYNFLKLSEVDSETGIQFKLTLVWRDARVSFNHLKSDTDRNILTDGEKGRIWLPVAVLQNTERRAMTTDDAKATVHVARRGGHSISPKSQTWKSMQYQGAENDLVYSRTYSADFQCKFRLHDYPFDTQKCFMVISLPAKLEDLVELDLNNLDFVGEHELSQYTVTDYEIVEMSDADMDVLPPGLTGSSQIVMFTLRRRFNYQLLTVYTPTFCLLLIIHTTLYYPRKNFDAAVMVSLTGMLTMSTLSLSVSNNLPPTNYIKLVDLWMLFGMITPFVDVILHTITGSFDEQMELARAISSMRKVSPATMKKGSSSSVILGKGNQDEFGRLERKYRKWKRLGRNLVPCFIVAFLVCYWGYVLAVVL